MGIVQSVRIATRGGEYLAKVDAQVGPFAVHRSWGCVDGWTLTHAATGRSVASGLRAREAAIALGHALRDAADWSFDHASAINSWTRYRRDKVRGLIRGFRRDDELGRFSPSRMTEAEGGANG